MAERKSRLQKGREANGLDLLRVYAAFVVVMLHVAAQGFYVVQPYWNTAVVYNAMGRVAVPLFFMISGALMLPRDESLAEVGRRVFKRILCPYVVWSVVYSLYSGYLSNDIALGNIFLQPPFFHLPFMFQLLMLYLVLPLLRGFWNNPATDCGKKRYVIGSSLLGGVLCEFVPIATGNKILGFQLSYLPYYAGLAMLGAYIYERRRHGIKIAKINHIYIYIYMIFGAATAYLVHWKTFSSGIPSEVFFAYQSPLTMLGAASLFAFASSLELPKGNHTILLELSASTFSIYLMHPLLLNLLAEGRVCPRVLWNTFYPPIGIPLVSLVVFLFCAGCSMIGRKVMTVFRINWRWKQDI